MRIDVVIKMIYNNIENIKLAELQAVQCEMMIIPFGYICDEYFRQSVTKADDDEKFLTTKIDT